MAFNAEQWEVCNREMLGLFEKGATEEIPKCLVRFISVVFSVPKNDGGDRPILNLKKVNQHIAYNHFKMENLTFAKHLIQEGDYFVKIDLKDAYLTIPLHSDCSPFLQFEWEGKYYQYLTPAFGLAPAPWAFTKMLKPVVAFLRERGIRLVIYLDDILVMNASRPSFRLVAWKLSGISSLCRVFRTKWSGFSWEESVRPHALHISPVGTVGSIGAVDSIKIPCLGL